MDNRPKKKCKYCNDPEPLHYPYMCIDNPRKPKRIKKKGKKTIEYETWRDEVAKPYLIDKYGEVCADCNGVRCGNKQLDVDHIKARGSHYALRMTLSNVQFLGRHPCHYEKTNGVNIGRVCDKCHKEYELGDEIVHEYCELPARWS